MPSAPRPPVLEGRRLVLKKHVVPEGEHLVKLGPPRRARAGPCQLDTETLGICAHNMQCESLGDLGVPRGRSARTTCSRDRLGDPGVSRKGDNYDHDPGDLYCAIIALV